MHVERLLDNRCKLAEGPVWHEGAFWFVDIEGKAIHRMGDGAHETWDMPSRVGAALPARGGRWLVALEDGLHAWTPGQVPTLLVDPEADKPNNRFNDAKAAPDGTVFAGTMAMGDPRDGQGTLWRYDGRDATAVVEQVTISNGLDWSNDRRTMWFIDTPTGRVDAFDYDAGNMSNRRKVIDNFPGNPDGLCAATDDTLFVAQWGGGCVVHCNPATGEHLRRIDLPADNVTSCCFGGTNLDTLYITTAAGGVFAVHDVGCVGRPVTLATLNTSS